MTEFPYFADAQSMHNRCTPHAYAMCVLAFSAVPAAADGWEAFKWACLVPAETFKEYSADIEGAEPLDAAFEPGETAYLLDGGPDFVVFEAAPTDGRRACRVHSAEGAEGFEAWFGQMLAMSRYVPDPEASTQDVTAYMSNGFVEPVVSAQMWQTDSGVVMRILETDRESREDLM